MKEDKHKNVEYSKCPRCGYEYYNIKNNTCNHCGLNL